MKDILLLTSTTNRGVSRLFDTRLRILGGFVYYGVSHYVPKHYLVYASEYGIASPDRQS